LIVSLKRPSFRSYLANAALRRDGVIDSRADQFATAGRRPLTDHVEDWLADLTAKGVSREYLSLRRSRIKALLGALHAERITDISATAVQ